MFDSSCHGSGGRPHQRSLCPGTAQEAGDANVMNREAQLLQRLPSLHCLLLPWARSARARTHASQPAAHGPGPPPGQHSPSCLPNAAPQPRAPFPAVHHRDILGPQGHGVGALRCGLSFPLYDAGLSQTRPQRSSSPAFPRPPDQARVLTAQLSSAPHRPPGPAHTAPLMPSPGALQWGGRVWQGRDGGQTRACPTSSFVFWIKYSGAFAA